MSTAPTPGNGQVFAYYQPVTDGMAVKKSTAPPEWLEPDNTTLACTECGWSLRPGANGDRARYNIPDPSTPQELRLFCGPCCNDGADEMDRLTGDQ
ncbi:hypothetical protein [Nocardia salmonicida]|uniref:hypothetical protein n=1 Tax=Nocardia salmonicida TaxID=53431 RepID=UPI0007A3DA44|nr:hypothetical protein [Nocardia salmonicida]MBC7299474.1 hypothetical protein [Nocardia sp.]